MPSGDVAISVRGLSKSYTIVHGADQVGTLREDLMRRLRHPFAKQEKETFWALKDVDFEVKRGEVVGIVGRNGAGKSTLLKILSRITEPTDGQVDVYGRIGSLLEVGTGFHPELTGRENVYLNGAILGMRKSEIDRRFDEIVEFAGVSKFLDTPVKRYSSGMYVRLAFAVAAHLEPEILIVDEVLSVGDAEFQKKCLGKMKDVSISGRTVLFVSHNLNSVLALCSSAILLDRGRLTAHGPAESVLQAYSETSDAVSEVDLTRSGHRAPGRNASLRRLVMTDADGRLRSTFDPDSELQIRLDIAVERKVMEPRIGIGFNNWQGARVFAVGSFIGESRMSPIGASCSVRARFRIPALLPGRYTMDIGLSDGNSGFIDAVEGAASIDVADVNYLGTAFPHFNEMGYLMVRSQWDASQQ